MRIGRLVAQLGEGLAEVGDPVAYGGFGQVARVVRFDTSLRAGA